MNYNFYIKGREDLHDGSLVLSLSEKELKKIIKHPSLETLALDDIVKTITHLRESKILYPSEIQEYVPLLKKDVEAMNKTFPNTPENPMIQPNLYLDQIIRIFENAVSRCTEDVRALILNYTDDDLNIIKGKKKFLREYSCGWARGLCSIDSVIITYGDIKKRIYAGLVNWSDNVERYNPTDRWVAHPVPKDANMNISLLIRPTVISNISYGYDFTLLPEFDNFLKGHIEHTIKEYKAKFN